MADFPGTVLANLERLFPEAHADCLRAFSKTLKEALMAKLIFNLVSWALALAFLGQLVEMRNLFRDEAVKSHRHGLMNLSHWNHKLVMPRPSNQGAKNE